MNFVRLFVGGSVGLFVLYDYVYYEIKIFWDCIIFLFLILLSMKYLLNVFNNALACAECVEALRFILVFMCVLLMNFIDDEINMLKWV